MPVGERQDPYLGCNFLVEVNGLVVGGFSEVSGLGVDVEAEEYREGGVNDFVHKLAGGVKAASNLVLKHGITDSDALWDWYEDVLGGVIERRNTSVVLLDSTGEEQRRWVFANAFTSIEYDITVTDTVAGSSRTYSNELGQPAQAVTDTSAFATCP